MIVVTTITAWFLADFLSGIVHWWEDRYLTIGSRVPFFQSLARDNLMHHFHPASMCRLSAWENLSTSAPYGLTLAFIALLFGAPLLVVLTFFFASFGNLVHRWAHAPRSSVPSIVLGMQWTGLFISHEHHWNHHFEVIIVRGNVARIRRIEKEQTHDKYCPMSNYVNPLLDYFKFFPRLEKAVTWVST